MKDRIDLIEYFKERGFKAGAEIGVADARYSELLLKGIPNLQLISIDPYISYKGNWRTENHQIKTFQEALQKLRPFETRSLLIRKTSLQASLDINDESLDFVFIDGAHDFNNVMLDILLWTPKVRKKGIVAGHDYCHFTNSGVVEAVNAYTEHNKIELNLIGRNGREAHADDRQPCWWFIKPKKEYFWVRREK